MLITKHYPKEHYTTMFNPDTGFFARIEDPGHEEPFWSEHGPELLDISITSWCDRVCEICYRNAGLEGKHMEFVDYEQILRQAATAGVMQIALGGGNPNQHPEFVHILEVTRKEYGIVPNYTTNGRGISSKILKSSAELCGAVAVSAYQPYEELNNTVTTLVSAGVTTNIHFVLDAHTIDTAILWLKEPPKFLDIVNAIVFLNYKPTGRKKIQPSLLRNSHRLEEFFSLIEQAEYTFRIGFDSCIVSGVASYTSIDPSMYDACEAGRFSMFISESMIIYPCSFMEGKVNGISAEQYDLVDVWHNSELFCEFRKSLRSDRCINCKKSHICMGGCPVFEEVNICKNSKDIILNSYLKR